MFCKILDAICERSSCHRIKVGALIVREGRTISTGWNGSYSGGEHCDDHFNGVNTDTQEFLDAHAVFSNRYEIHAEQNAIAFAARNGISTEGSTLYLSLSPCVSCAKLVVAAGITTVYYRDVYDRSIEGIDFLIGAGITVERIILPVQECDPPSDQ